MKYSVNIKIGLLFILGIMACQKKTVIDAIDFETEVINKYQFSTIDSVDYEYYDILSKFINLDSIIGDEKDPTEIALKLTDFTHHQWQHNGSNTPTKFEGLTILREAQEGKQFRCVEYSILLTELLNASNVPARSIGLKTKTVETQKSGAGHVAVEYYDIRHQKWIFADAQTNIIAFNNSTPLDAVELQNAIKNNTEITVRNQNKKYVKKFKNWIGPYLYYFDSAFDQRVKTKHKVSYNGKAKLMLTPIGSNNPTKFQISGEIENVIYTNSKEEFYPKIKYGD